MNINRDNYESYFIDFIEGNLSPDDEKVLQAFLKFNPDLAEELNSLDFSGLPLVEVEYPGKEKLRKKLPAPGDHLTAESFELFCIARMEGDLTDSQEEEFSDFLDNHPELTEKYTMLLKTRIPATEVSYPQKEMLYRKAPVFLWRRTLIPMAAAAAIILFFYTGVLRQQPVEIISQSVEPVKSDMEVIAEPEEKVPPVNTIPATVKVIKKTQAPVPVSNYKPAKKTEKSSGTEKPTAEKVKIASVGKLDLRNTVKDEFQVNYDRINYQPVSSPSIHLSSLSPIDVARYHYQKASEAMEDEDVLILKLASSGLRELNRITGSDAQLLASRDEEGDISGIRFKSRYLNLTAPISKSEE